jgi:gluconolactonase
MSMRRREFVAKGVGATGVNSLRLSAQESLFQATPLTPARSFTAEAEGPACDRDGNIYAVSYERKPTIGRVTPDGKGEVFLEMPAGSLANGIRFDKRGVMFIADYTGHNILRLEPGSRKLQVFAHEPRMSQPNDLAISADGTLWASDPNWSASTGQLWRIDNNGQVALLQAGMGTANGIEVSPDGKTLYVNESVQRNVWAFPIKPDKSLGERRLLLRFTENGLDGMRCDVKGNLYITRHGRGTVAVVSPAGTVVREVDVLGAKPTNLCFGGKDGRTCYVTEADAGRLVQFRVDQPGLEWQRWR